MLRKLGLSAFLIALILVACGRQVTPDRVAACGSGALPGHMIIRFRTANVMDFKNVLYTIVFNTSGNGLEPYANGYSTGYSNYNFIMVVDGTSGSVQARLFQILVVGGQPGKVQVTNFPPNQLVFNPNSNGQNTEFSIDFVRTILYGQTSPAPPTTAPAQNTWLINFITTDTGYSPLDTLGPNGKNDTSFQNPIDVTACRTGPPVQVPLGGPTTGVPAAVISGGDFLNSP